MIETVATEEGVVGQGRPLAEMVRRRHQEGRSYREMERGAKRAGYSISHTQLADYANDTVKKMPEPGQILAIACALGLPFVQVRVAAVDQFLGFVPKEWELAVEHAGPAIRIGAAIPPDLSEPEEAELKRMIKAWVAAREG